MGMARHPNIQTAKRWRVSILVGCLQGIVILGMIVGIAILNSTQITHLDWKVAAQQIGINLIFATCLAMPFVFMATIGTYIGFVQYCDYWLERAWNDWNLKLWLGRDLPDTKSVVK